MRLQSRILYASGAAGLAGLGGAAHAAEVSLSLTVPELKVAEYHRPYLAVWLERADGEAAGSLAVLYDVRKAGGEGAKWLKDLRQWWRKTGSEQTMPIDGVSGATRAPGSHVLNLGSARALRTLPAGDYTLVVEAAREVGGREVLKLPLSWPIRAAANSTVQGKTELGALSLSVKP